MQNNLAQFLLDDIASKLLRSDTKLGINHIFGGQIGSLWFSPTSGADLNSNEDDLSHLNEDEDEDEDFIQTLQDEFINALKKHAHAFGLVGLDSSVDAWIESRHNRHRVSLFGTTISFGIKVPNAKKRFEYGNDGIEQFSVLMHGSNYLTYAEIFDCPTALSMGNEFREEMQEIFDTSNGYFRLNQSGPSPIHPRVYVIDVSNNISQTLVSKYDEDIYIISNLSLTNQTVEEVFDGVLDHVDDFFTLCGWRGHMLGLNSSIHNDLEKLLDGYMSLGSNLFFINFKKLVGLRKQLLLIHAASLQFESEVTDFERMRKKMLDSVEKSRIFSPLKGYFHEHSELDFGIANSFFRTLEFVEKSISSNDVAIRTIFAVLTGAAIAMSVTLFLKVFS